MALTTVGVRQPGHPCTECSIAGLTELALVL